jgi:hypothetical protein
MRESRSTVEPTIVLLPIWSSLGGGLIPLPVGVGMGREFRRRTGGKRPANWITDR